MNCVGPYLYRIGNYTVLNVDIPVKNAKYILINTVLPYPREIDLCGIYKAGTVFSPASKKDIKLKEASGFNTYEWDFENPTGLNVLVEERIKVIKNFPGVRHYKDWGKLEALQESFI